MRWLVLGAGGMLGRDVCRRLEVGGVPHSGLGRADLDLLDEDAVTRAAMDHAIVVNCAAWTAVDAAESEEADAFRDNAVLPSVVARAATKAGARMVHVSTDYVFSGSATAPYAEDALVAPRSAYGRTKAAGEWAVHAADRDHLVVRTSWLYGRHGACFPRTIARLLAERGAVQVVDDQVGQPTWTRDVADLIVRLVEAQVPGGMWHATSSGQASWFELARSVAVATGLDPDVVTPISTDPAARPAPRPSYSVLAHDRLLAHGLEPIGDWQERWSAAASVVLEQIQ